MEFSIKFDSVMSGKFIIYIKGSQVIISLKCYFSVSEVCLDPDEMPHYVAFYLGLHCLPKYLFRGFWSLRG